MISANTNRTMTANLATYDMMRFPSHVTFQCVVGSLSRNVGLATMVSYSSIKVFINMFTSSLRLLTAPCGVDVVCVQLRIIDTHR